MTEIAAFRRRTTAETTPGQAVEARRIEGSIRDLTDFAPQPTNVEPSKMRKGMIRLTESPWDPTGNGPGWVCFDGNSWVPLLNAGVYTAGTVEAVGSVRGGTVEAVGSVRGGTVEAVGSVRSGIGSAAAPGMRLGNSAVGLFATADSSVASLGFTLNGIERARLSPTNGSFGVGSSNPEFDPSARAIHVQHIGNSVVRVEATAAGVRGDFEAWSGAGPGVRVGSNSNSPLYLRTNNTTRVTIDTSGNVAATGSVSTPGATLGASAGNGLTVNGYVTLGGPLYFCQIVQADPFLGSAVGLQAVHVPGVFAAARLHSQGQSFDFRGDGQAYKAVAGDWAGISDERMKDLRRRFPLGLSFILAVDPWVYGFKAETGRNPDTEYVSATAQNIEAAGGGPYMVQSQPIAEGDIVLPDGKLLDTSAMQWAFVNAFKELHAIVEAQAARIATLEAAAA